jgi:hypothetical protein
MEYNSKKSKKETVKNSTVAIDEKTSSELGDFCGKYNISKKDFIISALKYHKTFGIDPTKFDTPANETEKVLKAIEQLKKMVSAIERDTIKPNFIAVTKTIIERTQTRQEAKPPEPTPPAQEEKPPVPAPTIKPLEDKKPKVCKNLENCVDLRNNPNAFVPFEKMNVTDIKSLIENLERELVAADWGDEMKIQTNLYNLKKLI